MPQTDDGDICQMTNNTAYLEKESTILQEK